METIVTIDILRSISASNVLCLLCLEPLSWLSEMAAKSTSGCSCGHTK